MIVARMVRMPNPDHEDGVLEFDNGTFYLQGHGPVPVAWVRQADAASGIEWASADLAAWARALLTNPYHPDVLTDTPKPGGVLLGIGIAVACVQALLCIYVGSVVADPTLPAVANVFLVIVQSVVSMWLLVAIAFAVAAFKRGRRIAFLLILGICFGGTLAGVILALLRSM